MVYLITLFFFVCLEIISRYWWLFAIACPVFIVAAGFISKLSGGRFRTAATYAGIGIFIFAASGVGIVAFNAINSGFK